MGDARQGRVCDLFFLGSDPENMHLRMVVGLVPLVHPCIKSNESVLPSLPTTPPPHHPSPETTAPKQPRDITGTPEPSEQPRTPSPTRPSPVLHLGRKRSVGAVGPFLVAHLVHHFHFIRHQAVSIGADVRAGVGL